ncbi:MAG: phosphoglycerate kinase [Candidatus Latescibacteria bacterium]|nr:phosphoglycerate kinase [Candidatus Latescibacterota bacterium]
MQTMTLNDIDVRGKRVLMRVDYNVPLDSDGAITDDTRIRASLPTVRHVLDGGGRLVLMSHLGRPTGVTESLRLKPVAARLAKLLDQQVETVPECIGDAVRRKVQSMENGDCLMLENVRFHEKEVKNDPDFARALAASGDIFVNDAFGTAHRAHASTEGVAHHMEMSVAGLLMARELTYLSRAIENPVRPLVVILGGSKVSDKIGVTRRALAIADSVIIGGGMAYTFLKSQGVPVGGSLVDEASLDFVTEVLASDRSGEGDLLLPSDHVIAEQLAAGVPTDIANEIPAGWLGLDIGPESRMRFTMAVAMAGTVLWNGPMGVFEIPEFAQGTKQIATAIADATDAGTVSIIGGGDTAAAVNVFEVEERMSHVSTGGGASLGLLEGAVLPGVAALTSKA